MSTFAPLFVPDEMRSAVSGAAWLAAMLDVERAITRAGAAAGVVPGEHAAAIEAACVTGDLTWEALLEDGRSAGNPAEPLVRALAARVGEDTSRWVHYGATSQDVIDTAAMLVSRAATGLIDRELHATIDACADLALLHRDTPMPGRTLLQHAVPTTFGLRAASWLVALIEARRGLEVVRSGLATQLGGAAGTLAVYGDRGIAISGLFARELGLVEPVLPWHANRVQIAQLGSSLAVVAGATAKPALDIVLLSQVEVGELREGGDAGGSSTMPHKRNPIKAVAVRACAGLVRGHTSVLIGSPEQELDRAAGSWHAEWDSLCGALSYTGGAAAALSHSIASLDVDVTRMRENLLRSGDALTAERIASVLGARLGRSHATELVRQASRRAAASGGRIADELRRDAPELSVDDVAAALDPLTYLGASGELVDRALAFHAAESERPDETEHLNREATI